MNSPQNQITPFKHRNQFNGYRHEALSLMCGLPFYTPPLNWRATQNLSVAQGSLKLVILLSQSPSAGLKSVLHYPWYKKLSIASPSPPHTMGVGLVASLTHSR